MTAGIGTPPTIQEFVDAAKVKDPIAEGGESTPLTRKEVINIQPGDVIVYKCDKKLDNDTWIACSAAHRDMFPNNTTMVLDGGNSLEVYRDQVKE